MAKLQLEGTLTIGPPCAVECCGGVDGAEATLPVCVKADGVVTVGFVTRPVASPGSFVALSGIGPTDAITQGSFLYVITDADMTLRITCDDGAGGTAVELIPVQGLFMRQFPPTKPLELLEVRGSGRITYAACGPR